MRHLQINTQFFEEEQPNRLNFNKNIQTYIDYDFLRKATAITHLDTKFKTLILKRLFSCWSKIKCPIITFNVGENVKLVEERLRINLKNIRCMNRSMMSQSFKSEKRKINKSLSPTSSNISMNQSRATIFNEIIENNKLKTKNFIEGPQDTNLLRRVSKIQKMLEMVKSQHKKTEGKTISKIQRLLKRDPDGNDELQHCLKQIQNLRLEIQQMKTKQRYLNKKNQQLIYNRNTQSHNLNIFNDQQYPNQRNSQQLQFIQSKVYNVIPFKQVFIQDFKPTQIINNQQYVIGFKQLNRQLSKYAIPILPIPSKIIKAGPYEYQYLPYQSNVNYKRPNYISNISIKPQNTFNKKSVIFYPNNFNSSVEINKRSRTHEQNNLDNKSRMEYHAKAVNPICFMT